MKTLHLVLLSLLSIAPVSKADVTAVNILLEGTTDTYNVPAGKVLLVEHLIWSLDATSTTQRISFTPAGGLGAAGSLQLNFDADTPDIWTPARPIRIVGGGAASVRNLANWRNVLVVGLLVDPEDLYAQNIPTELDDPRIVGKRLVADAEFSSPRPRVTRVKSSVNLDGFQEDASEGIAETSSPSRAVVSVDADSSRKFMTVEAIARSTE